MNWEAFSAISTFLGAIATSVACIIALYQTRVANAKKLRVSVSWDNHIVDKDGKELDPQHYCTINISNIGNKVVRFTYIGLQGRGQKGCWQVNPDYVSDGEILPFKVHEIEPEHSLFFNFERTSFIGYIKDAVKQFHKVDIIICDTTGKVYHRRISAKELKSFDLEG